MEFENNLKKVIKEQYGSIRAFAISIDTPYSTVDNIFKRGIMGVSIQVVLKICSALNIDIEKIQDDTLAFKNNITDKTLDATEQQLLTNYRKLNKLGKSKAYEYIEDLTCNPKYTQEQFFDTESQGA